MAGEQYKRIKCTVYRADDPDDMSDIYVGTCGVHGEHLQAMIQPGKPIALAQPLYEVLRLSTYVSQKKIEDGGKFKTEQYDRPRFSINIDGFETDAEANKRVASLALDQGNKLDEKDREIEMLKAQLADKTRENLMMPDEDEKD